MWMEGLGKQYKESSTSSRFLGNTATLSTHIHYTHTLNHNTTQGYQGEAKEAQILPCWVGGVVAL
jgi:hypothetical protein